MSRAIASGIVGCGVIVMGGGAQTARRVLLCRCQRAGKLDAGAVEAASAWLLARADLSVTEVEDLCGLAAAQPARLAELLGGGGAPAVVVACRTRVVRWLARWAAVQEPAGGVAAVGIRGMSAEQAVEAVRGALGGGGAAEASAREAPERLACALDGWEPWYPVIDYDRCVTCGKCLDFCPFGVYARDPEGAVRVVHPRQCKFNCPACARICPRLAIVFPKHAGRPIDGDDVLPADLEKHGAQELCERLKRENIHDILARRGATPAARAPGAGS